MLEVLRTWDSKTKSPPSPSCPTCCRGTLKEAQLGLERRKYENTILYWSVYHILSYIDLYLYSWTQTHRKPLNRWLQMCFFAFLKPSYIPDCIRLPRCRAATRVDLFWFWRQIWTGQGVSKCFLHPLRCPGEEMASDPCAEASVCSGFHRRLTRKRSQDKLSINYVNWNTLNIYSKLM